MPVNETSHEAARLNLVAEIEAEAGGLSDEVQAAIAWPGVHDALASVPREAFVSADDERFAYCNVPCRSGMVRRYRSPLLWR
jgi:protein-L-isoaspartate O-methyltransferase